MKPSLYSIHPLSEGISLPSVHLSFPWNYTYRGNNQSSLYRYFTTEGIINQSSLYTYFTKGNCKPSLYNPSLSLTLRGKIKPSLYVVTGPLLGLTDTGFDQIIRCNKTRHKIYSIYYYQCDQKTLGLSLGERENKKIYLSRKVII